MTKIAKTIAVFLALITLNLYPTLALAQADFNPNFVISDEELLDYRSWTRDDVQKFLDNKGSYLRLLQAPDASGTIKSAADIIYDASQNYQINPKFLMVTLQKEQSLITDDSPTQKQLDWATGYAVCDGCYLADPSVQKHKGFGLQVDNAAGIMRWYYDNKDKSFVKKKDIPILIDNLDVTPMNWATAFLYTYTPHLHGNQNFWRIWQTWFSQFYPNGTLLKSSSSSIYWLIQDKTRRQFKNMTSLITRTDPKLAITVSEADLSNYQIGPEISFPNYSILKSLNGTTYLLDYDTLRPFASDQVVRKLGYNPDEIIEVDPADLIGYATGAVITASTTAPQGVIYQITDLNNAFYLLKDDVLYPIIDKDIIEVNYKSLTIEKHRRKELAKYQVADLPVKFTDGTLFKTEGSNVIYVMDKGLKRRIADDDTFLALGYKKSNVVAVDLTTVLNFPEGEMLYLNSSLLSAKNKYLGDSEVLVTDLYKSKLPSYLVAEYPSGRIISGKDIDTRRSIASLTKLLTAYESINQDLNLNKTTTFDPEKNDAYNNVLNFKKGEKMLNRDLFNTMLVGSINNTARMIAQASGLGESEFINAINTRLANWGADYTTITDTTGLDDGNKSTSRDLLKIFIKVLSNDLIKSTLAKTTYTFKEVKNLDKVSTHKITNTNQLITAKGRSYRILASKTGYTDEAGAVLIMLIEPTNAKETGYAFTKFLNNGSSGAEVKQLQLHLQKLGYFPIDAAATGKYGPTTEAAVKKFQTANKITPLGYVGPSTRAALNKTSIKPKPEYIVITMGGASAKRFDEPNKIANWISSGEVKIDNNKK